MGYFVIAEREIVLGFNLVGVQGQIAATRDEALAAFKKAVAKQGGKNQTKILILSEGVHHLIKDEVDAHQMTAEIPLVVEVAGIRGYSEGRKSVSEMLRSAIGAL